MARFTRVFGVRTLRIGFVRGLRFRLAVSYVAFFAILLAAIGFFFWRHLKQAAESDVHITVDADWDATVGYLHFDNERPEWEYDRGDPDEAFAVERLRHVYLLTDANGILLQSSTIYDSIGVDKPQTRALIQRVLKEQRDHPEYSIQKDEDGIPYYIRAGWTLDDHKHKYFLAIGRSLALPYKTVENFTRSYLLLAPGMLALASVFGWLLAGIMIQPVNSVAQAAQSVTGSNLTMQIPLRGAGDELDHLIDSFNQMTDRLHQSFEQTRRFSTDVSHELRTPITAIRGQLEVALFTANTPDQYREAIINAMEDIEKLSSIVRALLLLSQAESGQVVLQKAPLDLGEVVRDLVDQFQIPAEEKDVKLTASIEPCAPVEADHTQIERLLSNLLSNAVKYTPKGGSVRVVVGPAREPGWTKLSVEDTGVGIPAENLPHIFDRFYRVRNPQTNSIQGLGLGLSFVAWIVEAHGGRIDVASNSGEGTRFTVLLPSGPEASEPAPAESATLASNESRYS
ncbi:MAG TPA: ATP-binding protein [Bryobacteraceae bacterium]|jgi:heavy metal sensor kinase|nr:ATP-binding protein [Bryobacteraceae bacterium]